MFDVHNRTESYKCLDLRVKEFGIIGASSPELSSALRVANVNDFTIS